MSRAAAKSRAISRRGFLTTAAAGTLAGTLAARAADAQAPKPTKDTLRPVAEGASLAIPDAQLEKLAPAVEWSRGEMRKLRDVDAGLGGPSPVFLPAAFAPKGERQP